ncbi:MAG: phosphohydrolase, partial [Xanthomonadaceae bacterium]|nr:phosphohydrolase [Xanthomonadaceae bacterium]
RLQNGSIAVVTHRGNARVNTPRVAAITNPNGMCLATPLRHNGDSPAHAIKAVVDLEALKLPVSMAAIWGADAVL